MALFLNGFHANHLKLSSTCHCLTHRGAHFTSSFMDLTRIYQVLGKGRALCNAQVRRKRYISPCSTCNKAGEIRNNLLNKESRAEWAQAMEAEEMASVPASHNWLALGQLFKSATFTFFSKELLGELHVIGCKKGHLLSAVQIFRIVDPNNKIVVQYGGTKF